LIDAGMCPRLIEEMTMTPLRQRMLDALVLHGKAARTQEAYIDQRIPRALDSAARAPDHGATGRPNLTLPIHSSARPIPSGGSVQRGLSAAMPQSCLRSSPPRRPINAIR